MIFCLLLKTIWSLLTVIFLTIFHQSVYSGLAFPDSFHVAAGSTESTAKIQAEIFSKKKIGGLHKVQW